MLLRAEKGHWPQQHDDSRGDYITRRSTRRPEPHLEIPLEEGESPNKPVSAAMTYRLIDMQGMAGSGEGSIPVKIEKSAVEKLLKTSNKGSQIMLDVDGQAYDVLIKEIQFNPLKGQVDEIDFQALVSNEKVHSVAEIVLVNHDKLAAGVLQQHLEEISFRALPSALVDKVMVDVGDMKVGDVIKVKDLAIAQDKDVDLKTDLEAAVVSVAAVHVDPAVEAEEEAAEEEAK